MTIEELREENEKLKRENDFLLGKLDDAEILRNIALRKYRSVQDRDREARAILDGHRRKRLIAEWVSAGCFGLAAALLIVFLRRMG